MMASNLTYRSAGVDSTAEDQALGAVFQCLDRTLTFRRGHLGDVMLPNGFFANVLDLGNDRGLAISTDGVGSKVLVAQALGKYDTIGIDCVAMNVNDVLCVGAEPVSMVDYLAVESLHPAVVSEIARGLATGAEIANVSIPGGEIAQLPDTVRGVSPGVGFDLVGTCVGYVSMSRLIVGDQIAAGDTILGLRSTGIHSNGLSLARRVLFGLGNMSLEQYSQELGGFVGEVLLEPTHIYVREILEMLQGGLRIKALVHITSDGLLNLARIPKRVGYVIENLPEPQPIFKLIQDIGGVSDSEMFQTYNMGIGFCVVLDPADVSLAQSIAGKRGIASQPIGHTVEDEEKRVYIAPKSLIGHHKSFHRIADTGRLPGIPG